MTASSNAISLDLRCVGSTGERYCKTVNECTIDGKLAKRKRVTFSSGSYSNCFRQAQFSPDGTTVVTYGEDECLRSFVLPPDLLENPDTASNLVPHNEYQSPSNLQAYALYPHFRLEDPATTVLLSSSKDLPITLRNVLDYETLHASYPLTNDMTEAYIAPQSLEWSPNGMHFVAGSKDSISVFDATRYSEGPVRTHQTASGRAARKLCGGDDYRSCKGVVSALSTSPGGLLAAGTLLRNIAIYEKDGLGQCATSFSLEPPPGERDATRGGGITQLRWSPCGNYLLIAERRSDVIQIYDLRNTLGRVGWLSGRKADTTQKLGFDVVPTMDGPETWAGGTDGCVRMWKNAGLVEGPQEPEEVLRLHDGEF